MKKTIIYIFITCFTLSCIKKEQVQNNEAQIVELMNQNKIEEALIKIDQELIKNKTDNLLYLKASSLSMKAGVDIYALFPLLKIKIFDVAISQWSQNREFQKKNLAQKTKIGISEDDENKKANEIYIPIDKNLIDFQIEHEFMQSSYLTEKLYCEFSVFAKRTDKLKESYAYATLKIDSEDECNRLQAGDKLSVTPEIEDSIREALASEDHKEWFERKKDQNRTNSYVKLMGTFWTLIDLVPMISKIPIISASGFSNLEEAQAILSEIRSRHLDKSDELSEKVRKQLMMISALKVVAHLKNAFNFDAIKNPMDFVCSSTEVAAEEIVALQQDALYLINTIDDKETINKNKNIFEEVKLKFDDMVKSDSENPDAKNLKIKILGDALKKGKEENCE